jgi:hypothetical protein
MTAHLYCWDPKLELDPRDDSFRDRVTKLPRNEPSPRLLAFVGELLERYEDLTKSDDTVWGDGPLVGNIRGGFINISLIWSRYPEATPFIAATAHRHGLDCYDAQTGDFYPARTELR